MNDSSTSRGKEPRMIPKYHLPWNEIPTFLHHHKFQTSGVVAGGVDLVRLDMLGILPIHI